MQSRFHPTEVTRFSPTSIWLMKPFRRDLRRHSVTWSVFPPSTKLEVAKTRDNRLSDSGEKLKVLCASHPAVRMHPETGHKALFVNTAHTTHFEGWTMQESQPLLDYLFEHQVRSEFTYRFCWRPGSLAFWDNRCTQHNPVNDYQGFKRIMHRVTLKGDEPS